MIGTLGARAPDAECPTYPVYQNIVLDQHPGSRPWSWRRRQSSPAAPDAAQRSLIPGRHRRCFAASMGAPMAMACPLRLRSRSKPDAKDSAGACAMRLAPDLRCDAQISAANGSSAIRRPLEPMIRPRARPRSARLRRPVPYRGVQSLSHWRESLERADPLQHPSPGSALFHPPQRSAPARSSAARSSTADRRPSMNTCGTVVRRRSGRWPGGAPRSRRRVDLLIGTPLRQQRLARTQ